MFRYVTPEAQKLCKAGWLGKKVRHASGAVGEVAWWGDSPPDYLVIHVGPIPGDYDYDIIEVTREEDFTPLDDSQLPTPPKRTFHKVEKWELDDTCHNLTMTRQQFVEMTNKAPPRDVKQLLKAVSLGEEGAALILTDALKEMGCEALAEHFAPGADHRLPDGHEGRCWVLRTFRTGEFPKLGASAAASWLGVTRKRFLELSRFFGLVPLEYRPRGIDLTLELFHPDDVLDLYEKVGGAPELSRRWKECREALVQSGLGPTHREGVQE